MNLTEYKNAIVVLKDKAKKNFLQKINSQKKLLNIKIITLSELKKKYYFDYTKKTIYYICKNYNVIPEIAKIYLENLYYIKDIKDKKIEFLINLKKELEEKNLIIKNVLFRNYIKGKKIVLYNIRNVDKFYEQIFEEISLNSEIIKIEENKIGSKKELYKAKNKNEEITFIASKISELIKNGIDINKIKIANVQDDYLFAIKTIFKLFNIPIEIPNKEIAKGTLLIKKFKENYSKNIEETLEKIKPFIKDNRDKKLYKEMVDIVNSYSWCDDYLIIKDFLFKDLENVKIKNDEYKNAIRIIDFSDDIISDDEYIFLINFNQGIIPADSKNEDYLSDDIKDKLGISTSTDLNIKKNLEIQKRIRETKNLVITYSSFDLTSELYISNSYDKELFNEKDATLSFNHSDKYNKIKLISDKDENKKFGTISDELLILNRHYKDEKYCSYNNEYKQIDVNKLSEYLNHKLQLSYTSMNKYYECSFKYYLSHILKLDKYEDTFETIIGSIFHKVLSECFTDNYDFDDAWNKNVSDQNYEFNFMEKFFLNNLKEELLLIIKTIKEQLNYTFLKKVLYEKEIIVPIDKNLDITFKGYVDKILYDEFDGKIIVAIIDYKTGNPILSIDNAIYGLEMQLPVYIYLLKNTDEFSHATIGGFYLQKILNTTNDIEKKLEEFKLQGYSNSDINVLEKVDNTYENSKFIKSLKMTNNGFYSYSKVLNDEQINKLSLVVKDKIIEASINILNAKFDINPKEINNQLLGCKYCKFKDICYLKNADIVKLPKVKYEEFIGGDKNASVD